MDRSWLNSRAGCWATDHEDRDDGLNRSGTGSLEYFCAPWYKWVSGTHHLQPPSLRNVLWCDVALGLGSLSSVCHHLHTSSVGRMWQWRRRMEIKRKDEQVRYLIGRIVWYYSHPSPIIPLYKRSFYSSTKWYLRFKKNKRYVSVAYTSNESSVCVFDRDRTRDTVGLWQNKLLLLPFFLLPVSKQH